MAGMQMRGHTCLSDGVKGTEWEFTPASLMVYIRYQYGEPGTVSTVRTVCGQSVLCSPLPAPDTVQTCPRRVIWAGRFLNLPFTSGVPSPGGLMELNNVPPHFRGRDIEAWLRE